MNKNHLFRILISLFGVGILSSCGAPSTTTSEEGTSLNPSSIENTSVVNPSEEETSVSPSSEEEEDEPISVLFLGNSLMFFNDMPGMVEEMGTIAGKQILTDSVTQGSATISLFADETTGMGIQARSKIYSTVWDYIVIEPSRRASPWEDTVYQAEKTAALKIKAMADEVGAQLLIYSVWGNNTGNLDIYTQTGPSTSEKTGNKTISRKAHTKFMHDFGQDIANATGATMIEAGYAFENALNLDPTLNLYYSDDKHPSLEGSYLAGLTVFGTIYRETNAYMSFDKGLAKAPVLKEAANKTCLENLVPDLDEDEPETPPEAKTFNLLLVGSNYMTDHSPIKMFRELCLAADNLVVNGVSCVDGAYTNSLAYDTSTTYSSEFRAKMEEAEWDVVMFQITRRCTKSALDVEESEHLALQNIKNELFSGENAPKMYIYTMQSDANPAIFTTGSSINYSKTGNKESYTALEGTQYFESLATDKWSDCGDPVLFGSAYMEYTSLYNSSPTGAEKGYLKACCFYYSIFQKEIPDECDYYYNLNETVGTRLREVAARHCLIEQDA